MRRRLDAEPATIVILRHCFLGDFVVTIPALRALRQAYPYARIVFLTTTSLSSPRGERASASGIFDIEAGLIDEIVTYTYSDLRTEAGRSSIRERVGCHGPAVSLALSYSSEGLRSRLKRVVLCVLLGLPFPLGLRATRSLPAPRLFNRWRVGRIDVEHQYRAALSSVNQLFRSLGRSMVSLDLTYPTLARTRNHESMRIGIAPFTRQRVKQWPIESFAELIIRLSREGEVLFELYGAPEDREMSIRLLALVQGQANLTSSCGLLTPFQLRKSIENKDLLICLDSGPMHIASLVGTPVVAIFSQITLHQFWQPWGPDGHLVSNFVPCSQCDTRSSDCPLGTRACIDGISVDKVYDSVRTLMDSQVVDAS